MSNEVRLREIEQTNLCQIEALNQRGGRTLSIVDVMRAGTITPDAAGYLLWRVAHGASFLTGAVPGGAGKSTLLADLLAMLPPGEKIVTTPDTPAVETALLETDRRGICYLCHEIGPGYWYGYLWGPTVARFLSLMENGGRIACCLHADDPQQVRDVLFSAAPTIAEKALARVGLLLFMAFDRSSRQSSRIVRSIWSADGRGAHCPVYLWDHRTGALQSCAVSEAGGGRPPTLAACQDFMAELVAGASVLFQDVRARIIAFYESQVGAGDKGRD